MASAQRIDPCSDQGLGSSSMHKTRTIALLLGLALLITLSLFSLPASAAAPAATERVMVAHEHGAAGQALAAKAVRGAGGSLVEWVPGTDIAVALVPSQALAGLARAPGILAVEPDAQVQILGERSGTGGRSGGLGEVTQSAETIGWNLARIGAETAWASSVGRDVNVAILDTGIDRDHPDLVANIEGGYMAIGTGQNYDDDNNHGTHVAGIVAAVQNNGIGVAGVAPEADLYAVKVLDRNGSGYLSDIIEGIRWAIGTHSDSNPDNDIQVINMSFGTTSNVWLFEDALIDAESAGIMLVAAAGNNGPSQGTVLYPAAYPSVVAVGAVDEQDQVASFSSRGPQVELSAPGVSILSTIATGGYQAYNGTSMASPHVAGAAALILQAAPAATPIEVTVKLAAYAEDLGPYGRDPAFGFGLVRPDLSLASMLPPDPNTAPAASDQSVGVAEDGSLAFALEASDADGDSLTYLITQPEHGTTTLSGTGPVVTYAPDPDYNGTDSFTFQAYDGTAYSNAAAVTVTVTPVNDVPVAHAQSISTSKDTGVSTVLTGSDVDGDSLSFAVVTDPAYGSVSLNSGTGEVSYTPASGYVGDDSFTFAVYDGTVQSTPAVVSVAVADVPSNVLHVSKIEMSIKSAGRNVSALATVTIVDGAGLPVAGALVSGHWSGWANDFDSGVTDAQGRVTLESDKTKRAVSRVTTFIFTVDNVTLTGWTYDPSANAETSGSIVYLR